MNGGMGFHQKDHPRKPRATLEEVVLHAPDGVKACLCQRLLQYTHDPIAITQEGWGQPRHVGNQMPANDFSTRFSRLGHPILHTTLRE